MIEKLVARICHEANRAYCKALGDDSQLPWDDAPEWQKASAIIGVGFHRDNPQAGPEASHESWLRDKLDRGWRYGPVKSEEKKEHPCILPFNALPADQQAKDYIFRSIVHSILIEWPRHDEFHHPDDLDDAAPLDFSDALMLLKDGAKMARLGWNGRGMFVYLVPGSEFAVNRPPLLGIYPAGTAITYRPHLDIRNVDGSIATWVPSISDLMATDWVVVE